MVASLLNSALFGERYRRAVMSSGPEVYYRLGEPSGIVVGDASGHGLTGAYNGSPGLGTVGLLTGDPDTAVTFNGTNQYVAGATLPYNVGTIEALIKPASVTGFRTIASMYNSGAAGNQAWTFRQEGAALRFYYWNASNVLQTAMTGSTTLVIGTRYHVAVTMNAGIGGDMAMYVDGAQVASSSMGLMSGAMVPFRVGSADPAIGEFYSGVIDEVAFYARSLAPSEIASHYSAA